LGDHLTGILLRTEATRIEPSPERVKSLRAQLDLAGFPRVKIFIGGEVTPTHIGIWKIEHAPVDGFFVGDSIALATPIPFAPELKESDGKPLARRGLTPGTTPSPRLQRVPMEQE
jgi:nicotinic acid phosphoribosyltransferase